MIEEKQSKVEIKDIIQVDDELLKNISNLVDEDAKISILNILSDLHSADIAEIINNLSIDKAVFLFDILDTETAGEVVTELDENLREKILSKIAPEKISEIIGELDTDDATDIVSELPEPLAAEVLNKIDAESSSDVKDLLKYAEDTAGGIMTSDFLYNFDYETISEAINQVRKNADDFDNLYYIYVLNTERQLVGIVNIKSLIIFPAETKIVDVMEEDLIYVNVNVDQEEVANIMEKYDLVAIPVVDDNKKMLGRITIDDAIDVLNEEASEDIQKMAGLSEEQESSDSIFRISRIRLPWLIIALVIEFLNAIILDGSLEFLEKYVIAVIFIPIIMAMGGSSGTQASIVMIKSLGAGNLLFKKSFKSLSKEFFVSIVNGFLLSLLLFIFTFIFHNYFGSSLDFNFTIVLSISLLIIIITSSLIGATVPLVLKKLHIDPAIATGPFVTTMNDVIGLSIYITIFKIYLSLI